MLINSISLLTAIALSAAALTVTMFLGWLGAQKEPYLLSWSVSMLLVMFGVVIFGMVGVTYNPILHFMSFALILAGGGYLYAGGIQFRGLNNSLLPVMIMTAGLIILTGAPYLVDLAGVGTILGNSCMCLLLFLTGRQYWLGRKEAPFPMIANAILYALAGLSFLFCGAVLVHEGKWSLTSMPRNWAEDLNTITVIMCLTCIGAISLTLNQIRSAHHHRREAMTDGLTGLFNRRALFDRFSAAPLPPGTGVIMFDLDHFKSINDRMGHAAGDAVLAAFAHLVRNELRASDIGARVGGEEFCVVLPSLSNRAVTTVAERIRMRFAELVVVTPRGPATTTLSAGVAIGGGEGENFEDVLHRADEALYAAKDAGRNRVHGPAPRLVA